MHEECVSEEIVWKLGSIVTIMVLFLGVLGCSSEELSGVGPRPEVRTCCEIAGVTHPPAPSIREAAATARDPCDRSRIPTIDDEFACLAKDVPGGFGGAYLDDRLRLVVILVDPSQREAALSALQSLTGNPDWRSARIVKGDYNWRELYHWYYDRVGPAVALACADINSLDIDELQNRIDLGVLDEVAAECVAREVLTLGDVPCAAVVVETGVGPLIPD